MDTNNQKAFKGKPIVGTLCGDQDISIYLFAFVFITTRSRKKSRRHNITFNGMQYVQTR